MNPLNPSDLLPPAWLAGPVVSDRPDADAALPIESVVARLRALQPAPVAETEPDPWRRIAPLLEEAQLPERALAWVQKMWPAERAVVPPGPWGQTLVQLSLRLGRGGATFAFLGSQGNGKTAMACALACARMQAVRCRVRYSTLRRLSLRFEAAQRDERGQRGETRADIFEELAGCGLLILDEIGKGLLTPAETRLVVDLVDARHAAGRDTLLVGNLTEAAFGEWAGASLLDRMTEAGGVVVFNWGSFRGGMDHE